MASRIRSISIDCRDPYLLSRFWTEALGFIDDPADPNAPDDPEALLIDPRGLHPALLFLPVPEGKAVKNRVHLDLRPTVLRDDEVERLLGLGASLAADHRTPDGAGWAVLADPEGNEFCVERSAAERAVPRPSATGERDMPPVQEGDERTMLLGLLDWYRDGVIAKASGMPQHLAVATPLGSPSSVAGLVKHLALVEDSWFSIRFAGNAEMDDWADADFDVDPDWEFHTAVDEPLELQLDRYRRACEASRAITAAHHLDDPSAAPSRSGPFTLRWAVVHLLEETARHLGHLDILRELLDGATGE